MMIASADNEITLLYYVMYVRMYVDRRKGCTLVVQCTVVYHTFYKIINNRYDMLTTDWSQSL